MPESKKELIVTNLKQAKQTGELKTERIKEIVKGAVFQTVIELKEGRDEIRTLMQDVIAAVVETFQEKKDNIQEEVTASIEGAIEGLDEAKRKALSPTQTQVKQLQAQIDTEEEKLQQDINGALEDIKQTGSQQSEKIKAAIESAVESFKETEEAALLRKRYAQLRAQLAIVQANLASRYGEQFEEAQTYLNDAKVWYERAKENPEVFTEKVAAKNQEFEEKLGRAGTAVAKKEKQAKQLLRELWKSITEIFRDKQA